MTKKAPRFDSHVSDFLEVESLKAAADQAAKDRAANLPFFFELTGRDSYTTIFDSSHDSARPVGTISRPRLFGEARFKLWTVAAIDGVNVWQAALRPSAMQATRALIRYYAAKEEEARAAALAADQEEEEAPAFQCPAIFCLCDGPADCRLAPKEGRKSLDELEEEEAPEPYEGDSLAPGLTEEESARLAARWTPKPAADLARRDSGAYQLTAPGGAWIGPGPLFSTEGAARAWAYREGYAIAPAKAPQEAPLCPSRPALARLAAIQAGAF